MRNLLLSVLVVFNFLSQDLLLAGTKSPMTPEHPIIALCNNLFFMVHTPHKERQTRERNPNFLNDHDFITEKRYASYLGKLDSHFDKELDTRVFYTATGRPDANGNIPVVDPEAKALFIYIHGSGTQKASGINFSYKANTLASMGYAGLSVDLPFHFDGSRNRKMLYTDTFIHWLKDVITKYRVPGQPVYLAGHSFGPSVVAEFLTRFPNEIDGGAMISPAAYNKQLDRWFYEHTSQWAGFWGDTQPNHDGSRWGGMATAGYTWNQPDKKGRKDPTVVNPNLKLRIISGSKEEYFPGPLKEDGLPSDEPRTYDFEGDMKRFFKNAQVTIEPGVGHYIFMHDDANGHDVVLRELLALDGETLSNEKALKIKFNSRKFTETETLLMRYKKEPFFRQWVEGYRGGITELKRAFKENDQKAAREIAKDYKTAYAQREAALYENIRSTEKWAPEFFRTHQDKIALLGKKGNDADGVITKYYELLDSSGMTTRAVRGSVSSKVNDVEKRVIPPEVLERMRIEQQRKSAAAGSGEVAPSLAANE